MIALSPRRSQRILYLAGTLPARSETFVYREVFGLRERGWPISVASVHPPERGLGTTSLDGLADEVIPVYGAGGLRMIKDVACEACTHPLRSARTLFRCVGDLFSARDVRLRQWPKVIVQCLSSLGLSRRVRPLEIAHIHAHMAHVPTTIAMYTATQLEVGFSFTGHAVDLFRSRSLLEPKLRRAAFVASISRWHREFYQTVHPKCRALPLIRCGVDVQAFAPRQQRKNANSSHSPTILAVGRLVPKKGFDLLLEALAQPGAGMRGCECIMVGDGPERDRLLRLRRDLGLHESVKFAGARSNDEIRQLMQEADVFVLPCRIDSSGDRDGIPVVLMEAMASGLPVISGDLPAIRELIEHDRSGILVNPERVGELANSIAELIGNPEKRSHLARAGRRRIQAEFSLEINVSRLERSLEAALGLDPVDPADASPRPQDPSAVTAVG